ncbi:MAG: hypothetical protein JWP44_2827, partial [Mucilaginibacter sp.]|nr:hypothetical protein [Mucilaginibacter sp.]
MNKRWAIRDTADEEQVRTVAAALNIDVVLSRLLIHR